MKAGIVTFHRALNYGAVLQAYALQEILKKLDCNAYIVDYISPYMSLSLHKPQLSEYKNPLKYIRDNKCYKKNFSKSQKLKSFSKKYFNLTNDLNRETIQSISDDFDIFFAGSDQVWNDNITKADDTYFLAFTEPDKRCSYAASIGVADIPNEWVPHFSKKLSSFRAISVREESCRQALKKQVNIEAQRVLDPTLLLSWNEYSRLTWHIYKKKPYILLYLLFYSKTLIESAIRLSNETGFPVKCINGSEIPVEKFEDHSDSGIEEWLSLIHDAEFVLTNSFHGLAFSLNFNKNFNVELPPLKVNASSRIIDMLQLFSLNDRKISNGELNKKPIDYTRINEILSFERNKSIAFLKSALSGNRCVSDKKDEKSIATVLWCECSGCGYCEKICPTYAIEMIEDSHGFNHPHVDFDKCIQCGKCLVGCPNREMNNRSKEKVPMKFFAAYSKDENVVRNSSSGGMFYELANEMINQGGVVYGAAFSSDYTLEHRRVDCIEDLKPLMGSKYMQSNAYFIFDSVLKDLYDGKTVLFVGTPCQVAALRKLTSKFENQTILVDFVCHGVPSPKLIKNHMKYVEKYAHSKVAEYNPRSKIAGWGHHELFTFENGKKNWMSPISQAYKNIFYLDLGIRSSCFHCPFATFERCSDLTIADYWGIELKRPDLLHNEGTSMVLVNTEVGQKFFDKLDNINTFETGIETIIEKKQPHLFQPIKENSHQNAFWIDYSSHGWKYVAEKYAGCKKNVLVKRCIKQTLKKLMRRNR